MAKSNGTLTLKLSEWHALLEALKSSSFTCPDCGRTSHNPHDGEHRYCGACKKFFDLGGHRLRRVR